MIRIHIFLILLLFPLTMRSQEDICIGKKHSLYSTVLQEERNYWVHLPDSYGRDTTQRYQVIYLLDGDAFFHSVVGISRTFTTVKGRHLPPSIIVGVLNVDRTRDLTPTVSAAGRDGKIAPNAVPQGGGSELFSRFLTEELRCVIDNSYRTNGKNMLIGHSYSGLFTLNTFRHLSGCRSEPVVGSGQVVGRSRLADCRKGFHREKPVYRCRFQETYRPGGHPPQQSKPPPERGLAAGRKPAFL